MKQILFHGGSHIIKSPEIREPDRNYMTETKITQKNLYLILPYKISQLAILYAKKFNVTVIDAIRAIYKSNTYKELEKEETKLWHYGPVALLEYITEHQ